MSMPDTTNAKSGEFPPITSAWYEVKFSDYEEKRDKNNDLYLEVKFDFVEGKESSPLIVELSYGYVPSAVKNCPGHWDEDMNWHKGEMWPQDAIIEDIIAEVNKDALEV